MSFLETPHFPEDVSRGSRGGPSYLTDVVRLAGGAEARNSRWTYPLHDYDAAFGVRKQVQLETLVAFFHVMAGRTHGFRFKDWGDYTSGSVTTAVSATDQVLGTGDGATVAFQLVKRYTVGSMTRVRKISKPVAGTTVVALDGVPQASGWSVDTTAGLVTFTAAPGVGVSVSAGFEFDVPCRFGADRFESNWHMWKLHSGISVPLAEIRL